jgi:hypothetical protein
MGVLWLLAARMGLKVAWLTILALALSYRNPASAGSAPPGRNGRGLAAPEETLQRALLVCAVPMQRYLLDPAGGVVASLWLMVLVLCGYAYIAHAWGHASVQARLYWSAWIVLLLPWGFPGLSAHWPPGGAL